MYRNSTEKKKQHTNKMYAKMFGGSSMIQCPGALTENGNKNSEMGKIQCEKLKNAERDGWRGYFACDRHETNYMNVVCATGKWRNENAR